jgi:hypothetical protein
MSELKRRANALSFVIAIMTLVGIHASAQVNSTVGSSPNPFGSISWQIDRAPVTTTVHAVAGVNSQAPPAPQPNFFQAQATPASPFTVHEIHGNFALVAFNPFDGTIGSCGNGSIVAQILDQNGNAIAAVKLQVLGPGTTNVPITGTFSTPLSVTSLFLQYDVDLCGPQTVTLSLVMS